MQFYEYFLGKILAHIKKNQYLCRRILKMRIMTARRTKELSTKRTELLTKMLQKAGVSKSEIYDVAIRRWVNANLDLLTPADRQEYADVLSL